jgi:hypothetical protein
MAKIVSTPLALGPEKESAKTSLSELYHENTKINPATALDMAPPENYSVSDIKAMSQGLKQYPYTQKSNFQIGMNSPKTKSSLTM